MKKGRWVVLMLVMGLVALAAAPSPAWAHWRGGVFIGVGSWWGPAYPYWWYPPPYYPYYYPPPTVIIEQPPVYVEQPTPPPAPPAPRTGTIARAARSTTRRSRRARRTGSRFHRDLNEGRSPRHPDRARSPRSCRSDQDSPSHEMLELAWAPPPPARRLAGMTHGCEARTVDPAPASVLKVLDVDVYLFDSRAGAGDHRGVRPIAPSGPMTGSARCARDLSAEARCARTVSR